MNFSRPFFVLAIGYGWLLLSTLFGGSGYGIFVSYTLELFALLVLYTVYRLIDQRRDPRYYRKHQSLFSVWVPGATVITLHFLAARFFLSFNEPEAQIISPYELISEWQTWITMVIIIVFYLLSFSSMKVREVVDYTRNKFLVGFLLLTIVNVAGLFAISSIESISAFWVFTAMITIRLVFELLLNKKFELTDKPTSD